MEGHLEIFASKYFKNR